MIELIEILGPIVTYLVVALGMSAQGHRTVKDGCLRARHDHRNGGVAQCDGWRSAAVLWPLLWPLLIVLWIPAELLYKLYNRPVPFEVEEAKAAAVANLDKIYREFPELKP